MIKTLLRKIQRRLWSHEFEGAQSVDKLLERYCKAQNTKNLSLLESCFHPRARITQVYPDKPWVMSLEEFMEEHRKLFGREQIVKETFDKPVYERYQDICSVSVNFEYQINKSVEKGKDFFVMANSNSAWLIVSLVYQEKEKT